VVSVGLLLGSAIPPESAVRLAERAEELGFDELWFTEHYFQAGSIAGAAALLSRTKRLPVGVGVVSALARRPPVLAMELAVLSRLHPRRIVAAVGLGEPPRLREMGVDSASSSLAAVRACIQEVRALLDGAPSGDVQLAFPPIEGVPLYVGGIGPKMLELAGELADGAVLTWIKGPSYVRWACEHIAAGRQRGGRDGGQRVVSLALFAPDHDGISVRERIRATLARELRSGPSPITHASGLSRDLQRLLSESGPSCLAERLPEHWIDELTISGTPEQCIQSLLRQAEAGADAIVLFPFPAERADTLLDLAASQILPALRSGRSAALRGQPPTRCQAP
jgi:5,10-methylenetetrahydromethanopterin reductase